MTTGISLGLAIGLSLGVLFGTLADNIGLGMMIGVAVGLCGGPAVGALRKNEKAAGGKGRDEKKRHFQKISAVGADAPAV